MIQQELLSPFNQIHERGGIPVIHPNISNIFFVLQIGAAPIKDANAMIRGGDINSDDNWGHGRTIGQTSDEKNPGPSTKHAIDLIRVFDNYLKCNFKSSGSDKLENEEDNAEDLPESTQPNRNASLSNAAELEKDLLYEATPIKHTNAMVRLEDIISDDNWGHGRIIGQTSNENPGLPTKHAIDLIGAFDNYLKYIYWGQSDMRSLDQIIRKFDQ
ncbi:hypothetical protein BC332_18469 [Capsicum chinense]|nr:hypothetical protein BC332_18469 [Capsicum chinense]